MIDVMAKYLETGAPTEELNTDYCKIATIPKIKTPQQTAIKVVETILNDIQRCHPKLKFIKENGEYKAITGPETNISYFLKAFEEDLDFAEEVWNYAYLSLP